MQTSLICFAVSTLQAHIAIGVFEALALPPKNGSLIEAIIHDKKIVNVIKITGTLHTRIQA